MLLSKKEFSKSKINTRYRELKKDGVYVGARVSGAHRIHLFTYNSFYVEVWIIISLNQIQWIEIQENQSIIAEYAKFIDIKKDLGLS